MSDDESIAEPMPIYSTVRFPRHIHDLIEARAELNDRTFEGELLHAIKRWLFPEKYARESPFDKDLEEHHGKGGDTRRDPHQ